MTVTHLDSARYRRTPWKNGGGVTVDIAGESVPGAAPGAWDGVIWRFGQTRIERPGPFSDLSGFDRLLAVVEGHGSSFIPWAPRRSTCARAFSLSAFPASGASRASWKTAPSPS